MARQKNTKTHNIFLIDKNKLPGISGVPAPSIADVLATLMSIDERYKLQTLKPKAFLYVYIFAVMITIKANLHHSVSLLLPKIKPL